MKQNEEEEEKNRLVWRVFRMSKEDGIRLRLK